MHSTLLPNQRNPQEYPDRKLNTCIMLHCFNFLAVALENQISPQAKKTISTVKNSLGLNIFSDNEAISPTLCLVPLPLLRNTSSHYITPQRGESWALQMVALAIFLSRYYTQNIVYRPDWLLPSVIYTPT